MKLATALSEACQARRLPGRQDIATLASLVEPFIEPTANQIENGLNNVDQRRVTLRLIEILQCLGQRGSQLMIEVAERAIEPLPVADPLLIVGQEKLGRLREQIIRDKQ